MRHGIKQWPRVFLAKRRGGKGGKRGHTVVELSHAREFQVDSLACMQSPAENGQAA